MFAEEQERPAPDALAAWTSRGNGKCRPFSLHAAADRRLDNSGDDAVFNRHRAIGHRRGQAQAKAQSLSQDHPLQTGFDGRRICAIVNKS